MAGCGFAACVAVRSAQTLNLMLGRTSFRAHFEPTLSPLGGLCALAMAAYIFASMFLLGLGHYFLGSVLFAPVVVVAATMGYRQWSPPHSPLSALNKVLAIFNGLVVGGVLVYVCAQLHLLSKV